MNEPTINGWRPIHLPLPMGKAYSKGECRVILTQNELKERGIIVRRWHISISCANRYPNWDEIKDARYSLVPDGVLMAMLLPPKDEYVNLHPNCFHLHEIDHTE